MINFVFYEKNSFYVKTLKHLIMKLAKNNSYQIYSRNSLEAKITGKKIYLLEIENNGIEMARKIRNSGDWKSPIILMTKDRTFQKPSKLLILDVINLHTDLEEKITATIKLALHIVKSHKAFKFSYNNELYQIPFEDILYFEKDLNNNYVSIITKDNIYRIKESIKNIEQKLMAFSIFFKTHQSCIVNLQNIIKIDFKENIIYFKTKYTHLLSRNRKKELKETVENDLYDFN